MVIDKTTGRGCALSMASKAVTRKLIADGIVGKTIDRSLRINSKTRYNLLQVGKFMQKEDVYVLSQEGELTEEPLWTPSFIDTKIWAQAVSRFSAFEQLDKNVEKYLLSNMDEYLQSISDAELASMTRGLLLKHGIINTPVRQQKGKTYYFNENEIYSLDEKSELFSYESRLRFNIFKVMSDPCFNMNVWSKAVSQFEVGMFLYIAPPVYERVPGNNNKATFDHIRMTVGLPRYQFDSWEALKDEVKEYRREICQRIIEKLEQDRQFKKYGVPINFLRLSDIILLRDFSVEFIFELKKPKTDLLPDKVTTS